MENCAELKQVLQQINDLNFDIGSKDAQDIASLLTKIEYVESNCKQKVPSKQRTMFNYITETLGQLILQEIEPVPNVEKVVIKLQKTIASMLSFFVKKFDIEITELKHEETKTESKKEEKIEQPEEIEPEIEDDIFNDFLTEARDYIELLEAEVIRLEESPNNLTIINEVFRPFHTLKGVSGFMGLVKMNKISHETENLLDLARNAKLVVTEKFIEIILASIDLLKHILNGLSVENRQEKLDEDKFEKFLAFLRAFQAEEVVEAEAEEAIDAASFTAELSEGDEGSKTKKSGDTHIRVNSSKLDYLIDTIGELVISSNLIRQDDNVQKIKDQDFGSKLSHLVRVVSDLQMASMSLRMIPIAASFQKMKRVVRDLSHKSGKKIDLVLKGQETEIDRHLVDSLYDPLVHMIRNSCDHGIEDIETRKEFGKKPEGTILLDAEHRGNDIVITVKDDGKGLDKDIILNKAIKKGVVSKEHANNLKDKEVYELIFAPGFSTAEKITDVSGRGVGMDVVLQTIRGLGGNISIDSVLGNGCTFEMRIPLTLSIIEGLLVTISDELFVIPVSQVKRFIQPEMQNINSIVDHGKTYKLENSLIPIIYFENHYDLKSDPKKLEESVLVIINSGNKQYALKVDSIVSIQDIVVKSIGSKFKSLKVIAGATILGNGSVGLIVDVQSLAGFYNTKK